MSVRIIINLCFISCIAASNKKTRIIGGIDASILEYPFLASLRRISNELHVCGGTILNQHHILTAAHCFGENYLSISNLKIFLGTSFLFGNMGNTYLPERIFIHPGFAGLVNIISHSHDIAIVKIKGVIEFHEYQQQVNLPTKDIHPGDIGILLGWGSKTFPFIVPSNTLQKVRMVIQENNHCRRFLTFKLQIDQFCGFRKLGIGACIGDSGSPLIVDNKVIGISSISIPCAHGIPDVYTNVYSHLDFIETVLNR